MPRQPEVYHAAGMNDFDPQPTDPTPGPRQYSLPVILAIWAAATVPMGLLAFVVVPSVAPFIPLHPGLVFWMAMVLGMIWQFVLSLLLLSREPGGLNWASVRDRVWLRPPSDPLTGETRRTLWWWVVPAIAANFFLGLAASQLDACWTWAVAVIPEPAYTQISGLADPQFRGQWWILGLVAVSSAFNYLLGEELLFRGVLLPRMAGVFGKWDWVANTLLFGLYHVHKIWSLPTILLSSFGTAWATRRFRSLWMGVIVHGIEGVVLFVMVISVLA